jgi:hypothetical protein
MRSWSAGMSFLSDVSNAEVKEAVSLLNGEEGGDTEVSEVRVRPEYLTTIDEP